MQFGMVFVLDAGGNDKDGAVQAAVASVERLTAAADDASPELAKIPTLGLLHVGTAGFSNAHWVGPFYPPAAKKREEHLDFYQETFSVVEVNSTFYGTPSAETIAAWKRRAANGFQMGLKVPRAVTHDGVLASQEGLQSLRFFLQRVAGLGDTLGFLLFQCSRSMKADSNKLRAVAAVLEELGVTCRVAVEFREASWFQDHRTAAVHPKSSL